MREDRLCRIAVQLSQDGISNRHKSWLKSGTFDVQLGAEHLSLVIGSLVFTRMRILGSKPVFVELNPKSCDELSEIAMCTSSSKVGNTLGWKWNSRLQFGEIFRAPRGKRWLHKVASQWLRSRSTAFTKDALGRTCQVRGWDSERANCLHGAYAWKLFAIVACQRSEM